MKKLLVLVPFLSLATGCMYPAQSLSGPYAGQRPMYPRAVGPQFNLATLPIGRWDNVMMSAVGTPLLVLMKDGGTASGTIVSATSETLRLKVASGDVDLAAAEVMRVDRLSGGKQEAVKNGARGAAFGAGVVGVLGLIAGRVPPARLFAAGAIVGAEQNIEFAGLARGASIIYLSDAAAVRTVGAPPPPNSSARGRCAPGVTCNSQIRYRR